MPTRLDGMVLKFTVLADYALLAMGKHLIFATHGHVYNKDHLPPLHKGDILLHGHTHIPVCEEAGEIRILNPGSLSIPKEQSPHSYMTFDGETFIWKNLEGTEYLRYAPEEM